MAVRPDELKFNEQGLIPAIAQDRLNGEVRMMAWMDREAVLKTLETRRATFYSRSRGKAWVKGEESGNFLQVAEVHTDCDRDTVLLLCDPVGPSCHTGSRNCFFETMDPEVSPSSAAGLAEPLLQRLEGVILARQSSTADKSYTKSLLNGGAHKVGGKIHEEAGELVQALASESEERVANEAADLLFHMLVGLRLRGVGFSEVLKVLARRQGVGGHVEKAARKSPTTE
jgi:phosphoribosyl-AMP cyclohydrolase / phosphoribosyl-ATP pyrophosphohydrolase